MTELHYSYWIRPRSGHAARQPAAFDEQNQQWLSKHGWKAVSYKEYVAFRKSSVRQTSTHVVPA